MKILLLILLIILSHSLFAQHNTEGECKLKLDNKDWLWDFKDAEQKEEKLALIVDKIIEDSNYLSSTTYISNKENELDNTTSSCADKCTMRFVLIYGNTSGLILDLAKYPHLEDVLAEFTSENISKIELNEKNDHNIYGLAAKERSGIILRTDDKNLKKIVRRTLRDFEKL